MMLRLMTVCVVLCVAGVTGCAAKNPAAVTYPVSGSVNYDGSPLAEGQIAFSKTTESFVTTINIKDGKFEGEAIEGELQVKIFAYKKGEPNPMYKDDPNAEVPMINYLPKQYNTNSKLTATVKPDGANSFTFDLNK